LSVAPIGPLARGESPVLPAHSMSSRRRVPARSGRSAGATRAQARPFPGTVLVA